MPAHVLRRIPLSSSPTPHTPHPTPPHPHPPTQWSFVGGKPVLNEWPSAKEIPVQSPIADEISAELKRRGFQFVGPKICYSLMQSCGLVVDHVSSPQTLNPKS
jgi:3-methyladenine DNA glycosylase Tag